MNAQNVLLVDDQPLIRKSLRSILESIDENLIIIAASSLEEAIRYIHSGQARPDLLVDDQVHPMPEGAQLYAQTVTNAVESLRRQPAS